MVAVSLYFLASYVLQVYQCILCGLMLLLEGQLQLGVPYQLLSFSVVWLSLQLLAEVQKTSCMLQNFSHGTKSEMELVGRGTQLRSLREGCFLLPSFIF